MDPTNDLRGSDGDEVAEAAYRWTIRVLYIALLAANLYVVWDMYRDTTEAIELRARFRQWADRARNCEGCKRREAWIRSQANRIIYGASEYLETVDSPGTVTTGDVECEGEGG